MNKYPVPTNVKSVNRFRVWATAIFLLSSFTMVVANFFVDIPSQEATRSILKDIETYAFFPTIASVIALYFSTICSNIAPLKGSDLMDMVNLIEKTPELDSFARAIKAQGRDPVREDYKTASRYAESLKKEKANNEARAHWESLQT